MALTGDFKRFEKLKAGFEAMALPGGPEQARVLAGVAVEINGLLKKEFTDSRAADGSTWKPTVTGAPALVSKKLASGFVVQVIEGGVAGRSPIPWLIAHQEGHTFPAREAKARSLFYDKRGRRIRLGVLTKKALKMTFVEERIQAAHQVKQRELPPRPSVPEDDVPPPWERAINVGAIKGMTNWRAKLVE